jgi:hypothetical protein
MLLCRRSVDYASGLLRDWCGKRLSDYHDDIHKFCRTMLHDVETRRKSPKAMRQNFDTYRETMDNVLRREMYTTCIPIYRFKFKFHL